MCDTNKLTQTHTCKFYLNPSLSILSYTGVHPPIFSSNPLARGSFQPPPLFLASLSNSGKLGSQHLPSLHLVLPFRYARRVVSELLTPTSVGNDFIPQSTVLVQTSFAFSLIVSTHFQSYSGQHLCHPVRLLSPILHFILGSPDFLNDVQTFAYVKVLSLCCHVLWVVTNLQCPISALTVS